MTQSSKCDSDGDDDDQDELPPLTVATGLFDQMVAPEVLQK